MKLTRRLSSVTAVFVLLLASSLSGATYLVPDDRELVDRADAIVVGTAISERSFARNGRINTSFDIRVEAVLKGDLSLAEPLRLTEAGGVVGDRIQITTGSPRYAEGQRVLIFLEKTTTGYRTWGMSLGKFSFVRTGAGPELLLRAVENEEIFGWDASGKQHVEPARDASAFLSFIREAAMGDRNDSGYLVSSASEELRSQKVDAPVRPDIAPTPVLFTLKTGSFGYRWEDPPFGPGPSFVLSTNGTPAGFPGNVDTAMAVWNNDGNSNVNIRRGGSTTTPAIEDGRNVIQFNAPLSAGVIGFTNIYGGTTHTHKGDTMITISEADIRISSSVTGASAIQDLMAHELGHSLGFRHSDQVEGSPYATDALMKISASGRGGSLKDWDRLALSTVYGTTTCPTSTISSQPNSTPVIRGQSVRLAVGVKGEAIQPLTFQWYQGNSGDTRSPVAGGTGNSINVSPTSDTSYWVRVVNGCDSPENSTTALVTVTDCTLPAITTQPQPQTVNSGQPATLSVQATGTSVTYLWREVTGPGTSIPAPGPGSNNSNIYTTPALTVATSYFVVVSACDTSVNSNTVQVSIAGVCTAPAIVTQPSSVDVTTDQTATFNVVASGTAPLTYQWYQGTAPNQLTPVGGNSSSFTTGSLSATTDFWVRVSNACPGAADSATATATVTNACVPPPAPEAFVVATQTPSGEAYEVFWTSLGSKVNNYEVQESTTIDFTAGVTSRTLPGLITTFIHPATPPNPVAYYYRVRAFATCNGSPGPFSAVSRIVIIPPRIPPMPPPLSGIAISVPADTAAPVIYPFLLLPPAGLSNVPFTATTDEPFMTVSPSSGVVPAAGIVLTVTASPVGLPNGTTMGSVVITFGDSKGETINTHTGSTVPTSFSVVTPVTPAPKSALPPDNTLIIPAVTHVTGQGAEFVSDVRITNTANQAIRYQLTFTPSGTNGTTTGNRTNITVQPDQTTALNDIVQQWYGFGLLNDGVTGVLEIRPENYLNKNGESVDARSSFTTVGSSRTYAKTSAGTFGQFIPAISFSRFVGKTTNPSQPTTLSLQQIAQSPIFRTNLGIVEASGQPATVSISVFNGQGTRLGEFVENLQAGEHRQFNRYLETKGITNLADGRIELRVTSDTGRITGYASVLDNVTSDPLLVSAVRLSEVAANKYVVPGIADIKGGAANWRSDVRVFNSASSAVSVTLRFFPQGAPGSPIVRQVNIAAGQVLAMDNLLETTFGVTNTAGALHVETANQSALVVTARTYDQRPSGTYGQFIPAVVQNETAGAGDRPLQVLQLEHSDRFRTNFGITEVSGQPVTVRLRAFVANSTFGSVRTETLAGNEFRQLNGILQQMGLAPAYNARVTVEVISGSGRVTAYGSMIDNLTQDPTYIPAQ